MTEDLPAARPCVRLRLVNPNTNPATTAAMLAIARNAAKPGVALEGVTAPFGVALITDEAELTVAADAVLALGEAGAFSADDGVIVAAFGDPGRERLADRLAISVTGIAEAAFAEAATHGSFAVVTTTPDLAVSIFANAHALGHGARFRGVALAGDASATREAVLALMADEAALLDALETSCRSALSATGAGALVIGGGPLASAAATLRARLDVPIIEPVPAAVRLATARARRPRPPVG